MDTIPAEIYKVRVCCDLMEEALSGDDPHIIQGPVGAYITNRRGAPMDVWICPWCGRQIQYEVEKNEYEDRVLGT